jgi:hypothetical protein
MLFIEPAAVFNASTEVTAGTGRTAVIAPF